MSQKWWILIAVAALATVLVLTSDHKHHGLDQKTIPAQQEAWLIVPGVRVGSITRQSTLTDLQSAFGQQNVKEGTIYGPEGIELSGAVVYPNEITKKLEVVWKEKTKTVETILIHEKKSLWHTQEGVTIGTTLKQLETLNGGPFTLSGFGWDYGGRVLSWGDKGKLRKVFQENGSLALRLNPGEKAPENLVLQVSGENDFQSSNPAMQKINPSVDEMAVIFR